MYAWILIVLLLTVNDTLLGVCSPSGQDITSLPRPTRQTPRTSKSVNPHWNATSTDQLKQDLLFNYDKFARPTSQNTTTVVHLSLFIRHLELDEQKGKLTIHCLTRMVWVDHKLQWNSSKYNGLNTLRLANHELWQPDILAYNSATGGAIDHYGEINFIVYNNGTVLWVPPTIFNVFCTMDFRLWPFDTQNCSISLGSWTYDGDYIDLINDQREPIRNIPELFPNSEWELVEMFVKKHTQYFSCCSTSYPNLTFYFSIKRQTETYQPLVLTPASVIVLMMLATFWLPPSSNEKIVLASAAVIVNTLFLLYFMQKIPSMASQVPYVVLFYTKSLYMGAFSIAASVFVLNLATNPMNTALPWLLKKNLNGLLGKCLMIRNFMIVDPLRGHEMTDTHPVFPEQNTNQEDTELDIQDIDWVLLAVAIDRVFFLIYLVSFAVLVLVYTI